MVRTLGATAGRLWVWLVAALWLVPLLIITARVTIRPLKRTVTPLYHTAVERWSHQQPLYDGPTGMNYLPTFVPLFVPYHALPLRLADVLWRSTAAAGLAWGLWGFARRDKEWPPVRVFALLTLLGFPLCLGALSNGQANAHLGAALLLAAWFLAAEKLWGAMLCLALAAAIKPLGLAAAGLALAAFPRLWWRLAIGLFLILAIPFLLGSAPYVQCQFHEAFLNLQQCSEITEHRFADLNGLLRTFGVPLTGKASLLVRAAAGAALALLCAGVLRRLPPNERALAWLASAVAYLMLFNPMNESNSYVIFGPVAALWTWHFFTRGRTRLAWTLVAMLATMSLLPTLLSPWLGTRFALGWHPAMVVLFLGIVLGTTLPTQSLVKQTSCPGP